MHTKCHDSGWAIIHEVSKGHCQEEFAVLGQFCAKIITLRLLSKTKSFCKATISNEFYQKGLTIINFLRIFGTHGIKI